MDRICPARLVLTPKVITTSIRLILMIRAGRSIDEIVIISVVRIMLIFISNFGRFIHSLALYVLYKGDNLFPNYFSHLSIMVFGHVEYYVFDSYLGELRAHVFGIP